MPDSQTYPGHPKLLAVAIMAAFVVGAALIAAGIAVLVIHLAGVTDETTAVVVALLIGPVIGLPMGLVGFEVADHICTERYGEFWIL